MKSELPLTERLLLVCGRKEMTLSFDHVIIWGETHLRHVLKAYTAYYNATRTHLGIDKDARRPIERCGVIAANAVLGGLHHRYARI